MVLRTHPALRTWRRRHVHVVVSVRTSTLALLDLLLLLLLLLVELLGPGQFAVGRVSREAFTVREVLWQWWRRPT